MQTLWQDLRYGTRWSRKRAHATRHNGARNGSGRDSSLSARKSIKTSE
jgi:hypothetical protein